jgi:hypothetical protein
MVMENPASQIRRRVPYGLPALGGLECSSDQSNRKVDTIAALLREIAVKTQNDHLQCFYSIRLIAEHFHIAPAMVARIYHRLGAEGLLRMVWGSKTLLEPVKSGRNGNCRCVGIPVDLNRFVSSPDYRESVLLLQVEMWRHEIGEHLLFFREHEDEIVAHCKGNHHPDLDTLIWLFPRTFCRQILLQLHDLGLRVLSLSERAMPHVPHWHTVSDGASIRKVIRKQLLGI